jgi:hypothetical protein
VLTLFASDDPVEQTRVLAFTQALAQLGWTDGRNVRRNWRGPKPSGKAMR